MEKGISWKDYNKEDIEAFVATLKTESNWRELEMYGLALGIDFEIRTGRALRGTVTPKGIVRLFVNARGDLAKFTMMLKARNEAEAHWKA